MPGESGVIAEIINNDDISFFGFRQRLLSLGFVPGSEVKVIRRAPFFGDPTEYEVRNSHFCLRKAEAKLILLLHEPHHL
jgi:Fe2+ transport system protein FeoA